MYFYMSCYCSIWMIWCCFIYECSFCSSTCKDCITDNCLVLVDFNCYNYLYLSTNLSFKSLFYFLTNSLSTHMGLTTWSLYTLISSIILSNFVLVYSLYLMTKSFSCYNSTIVSFKNLICYYFIVSYYYFELSYAFNSFSLVDCYFNSVRVYCLNELLLVIVLLLLFVVV